MIVVDASVVVELLLRTGAAERIESRVFRAREALHAPALLYVEVTQVFRRYVHRGDISATRGHVAITPRQNAHHATYAHRAIAADLGAGGERHRI